MSTFNENIQYYAQWEIEDRELLDDRRDRWQDLAALDDAPPYYTLRVSENFAEWRTILEAHNCDYQAYSALVKLATRGPRGTMEACRIMHHFLKDKATAVPRGAWWGAGEDPRHSKWLKNSCERACDALENPEPWNHGPEATATGPTSSKGSWDAFSGTSKGKGKGKGPDGHQDPTYHPGASSSSTPLWGSSSEKGSWGQTGYRGM